MTAVSRLAPLTPETATGAAADILRDLAERTGQVGQMAATMAHSPALLQGYLDLVRAMKRSKLSRRSSELISIAVQARQSCQACLHSHEGDCCTNW